MVHIIAQKAVFGGDCIGKIDGKTVFISAAPYPKANSNAPTDDFFPYAGALPGEELAAEIVLSKKDYDKAVVKKVLRASPRRVKPLCPVYGLCGGCNFQHADYGYQLELKKNITEDLLARALGPNTYIPGIEIVSGPDTEYRSRFQFHGGGLKQRNSDAIVRLKDCPCAVPPLRRFLQRGGLSSEPALQAGRTTVFADGRLVSDNTKKDRENPVRANDKVVSAADNSPICTIELNGKRLNFDVRGFFQSNMYMLEKALPLITKDLHGKRLLDMYGGAGVLSVFAAEKFESVTIVESEKRSLAFAKPNYQNNGIACELNTYTMRGSKWADTCLKQKSLKHTAEHFDAVIIDPPRTGIEKKVIDYINGIKPAVIRSLSCDPATHARDLKHFVHSGYKIERFYMLDFYPHTSHIESLAYLVYKGVRNTGKDTAVR